MHSGNHVPLNAVQRGSWVQQYHRQFHSQGPCFADTALLSVNAWFAFKFQPSKLTSEADLLVMLQWFRILAFDEVTN